MSAPDPMPAVRSILGMPPEPKRPPIDLADVLVDIAAQLRIANQIAYLNAYPGMPSFAIREQIEKELFS